MKKKLNVFIDKRWIRRGEMCIKISFFLTKKKSNKYEKSNQYDEKHDNEMIFLLNQKNFQGKFY